MEKVTNSVQKAQAFITEPPYQQPAQTYMLGLRGFVAIQSFLWVFLSVFVPAAVKDSPNSDGPLYQTMLRKTLSVLFWNETLIYSTIILLSARMICLPFLTAPSRTVLASSVFRRGLRLWFPVAISLAISHGVLSSLDTKYIDEFKNHGTSIINTSIQTPYLFPDTLAYWNSVFEVFWVNKQFALQAANFAFPSNTLWIVSTIFQQSYTVYLCMVVIPYTRKEWRVVGGTIMILTAWWTQSWAWYSITGLLLADAVMNMDFKARSNEGIPIGRWVGFKKFEHFMFPSWIVYGILCAAGLLMQYLWTAWRPDLVNAEVRIHTGEYYTGGLNTTQAPGQPAARDDNYVFLLGFFLFLESSNFLQIIFRNPVFVYLGKRSFSKSPPFPSPPLLLLNSSISHLLTTS